MQMIFRKLCIKSPLYICLYGLVVLSVVYIFQYGFGYQPCELCLYQRVPWAVVIVLGLVAYKFSNLHRPLMILSALVIAIGAIIAIFHAGVEYGFWAGFESCYSTIGLADSGVDLLNSLNNDVAPKCDSSAWTLFGISMAGYNALLSIDAFVFAILLSGIKQIRK